MARVIKYGTIKDSYSDTEVCRVCHGTGRQTTPKKKKSSSKRSYTSSSRKFTSKKTKK